jgi:hypothetical protein
VPPKAEVNLEHLSKRNLAGSFKLTVAPKIEFHKTIQADLGCPVLSEKIFHFAADPNQQYIPCRPVSHEGRFAIVKT